MFSSLLFLLLIWITFSNSEINLLYI
jgi:hypothetical protein